MADVRLATEADIPAIVGLAKRMHGESPRFARLTFVPEKVAAAALAVVSGRVQGGALVAEKGRIIVGMMVGFVTEHFFGAEKTASDLAVYVAPEHRGGLIAVKLIRAFEQIARKAGAVELLLGISTEVAAERTLELYQGLGYRRSGFSVLKELF